MANKQGYAHNGKPLGTGLTEEAIAELILSIKDEATARDNSAAESHRLAVLEDELNKALINYTRWTRKQFG